MQCSPSKALFSLLLLFGISLSAQEVSVREGSSFKAIPEVYIISEDGSFATSTTEQGKAQLTEMKAAAVLEFQHPAYQNETYTYEELQSLGYQVLLIPDAMQLPEYTVSANRIRERYDEVSNDIDLIDPAAISLQQASNSADLLQSSGKVYIQKSQLGGGSPVLRGLEANKVLLVVDGVRMNNAIYRSGHLQNALTIDNSMIDQVEVVFGPGSLVYGSDALGGVVHYHTRDPQFSESQKMKWNVLLRSSFQSAMTAFSNHADISVGNEKIAYLASFSYSDFDHLRIGSRRSHGDENWGLDPFIINRVNGEDLLEANDSPEIMRNTAYHQYDILQKLRVKLRPGLEWRVNFQKSASSNIPRHDRLNDLSDAGLPKFAEWNYGPQERTMIKTALRSSNRTGFFDRYDLGLSWQGIAESRLNRRLGDSLRSERYENVKVWNFNLDFSKSLGPVHQLQYGIDFNQNDLISEAIQRDVDSGQISSESLSTRYPDGENFTSSLGMFIRHKWEVSDRLHISDGLRVSNDRLESNFTEDYFYDLPFNKIEYNNVGLTFHFGANYTLNERSNLTASVGTGYRNPNIDDVGKIFDFEPGQVVIPNADVRYEYAYSADLGYRATFFGCLKLEFSAYYTFLDDVIRRQQISLGSGQTTIVYEGEESQIFANRNTGQGQIYGGSVDLLYQLSDGLSLSSNLTYTKGRDLTSDVPLGHIPPLFGETGFQFRKQKFDLKAYARYQAEKPIAEYSLGGEDKLSEALPTGTPAWITFNLKGKYDLSEHFLVTAGIENLLDEHYKPFAAGISAPGRNFMIGLTARF